MAASSTVHIYKFMNLSHCVQGIDIVEEPDGSQLTVHNLQLEDNGTIGIYIK